MKPLEGVRVLEMSGIGPVPFSGMLFADMGADVVVIDRPGAGALPFEDTVTRRGKKFIELNLKSDSGLSSAKDLIAKADILIEGYRPSVMEKLGIGPDTCLGLNKSLVYGRMTGWGQTGPLRYSAGHDINYLAMSGALHGIGRANDRAVPPLNLVGDYGGGAMVFMYGLLCAYISSQRTGYGQVVDSAMIDGARLLMSPLYGMFAKGLWEDIRGVNLLDTGAPFYDVYECQDGRELAVGALEPEFYRNLLAVLGLESIIAVEDQYKKESWPTLRRLFEKRFMEKPRDAWVSLSEGVDCCLSPVLSLEEAQSHELNESRECFFEWDGMTLPVPAPKLESTPAEPGANQSAQILDPQSIWLENTGGSYATGLK